METDLYHQKPRYILGGGSNVLFSGDYAGLIIRNSIPGISIISEDRVHTILRAGGGVVWDDLVSFALENNLGGLENLSMIPGLAGAAPIQNIGAYGVELEKNFVSLNAMNMKTGQIESFDNEMCRFGYRYSIFKDALKGTYLIVDITLRLDKKHEIHVDYGNLKEVLASRGITKPTIHDVSRAVREIRSSRLPDPAVTGNAGSFFKNPVISKEQLCSLQSKFPNIPFYPVKQASREKSAVSPDDIPVKNYEKDPGSEYQQYKVPAGWLIEQGGFKGKREGDAGVHEQHALILVNHGRATGRQLLGLAHAIQQEVLEQFGISLEPEVNIVGNAD